LEAEPFALVCHCLRAGTHSVSWGQPAVAVSSTCGVLLVSG
jgi:hypothetical protein